MSFGSMHNDGGDFAAIIILIPSPGACGLAF